MSVLWKVILGQQKLVVFIVFIQGNADLCAAPEARVINFYPSITETIPPTYPGLRQEFGKLETLMWRQHKGRSAPTPVLPEANDRWSSKLICLSSKLLLSGYTLLDGTTAQSTPRSMDPTGTRLSEASNQPLPWTYEPQHTSLQPTAIHTTIYDTLLPRI